MKNDIEADVRKSEKIKAILIIIACVAAYCLIMLLFSALVGKDATSNFEKYLEKNNIETLPSDFEFYVCSLERDKDKCYTVLNVIISNKNFPWETLPLDKQKADLKYLAKNVIDYANEKSWDNDYYLYVNITGVYLSFVYDYETDILYYPECLDCFQTMYAEFKTIKPDELIGTPTGENFLISNGLATIKHEKAEISSVPYTDVPYSVFIYNGKFGELGKGNSLSH